MANSGTIEITGLDERLKQMGQISTKNPVMRQRINEVIRQTLRQVRSRLTSEAQSGLQMNSDPRKAYKAVRSAVYRRIFGGQVNILQSRRAHGMRLYEPPRTLRPGQRGGNRVKRGQRTTDLMSYQGTDRGFILRFLNAGTGDREAGTHGGRLSGNRGSIAPRNWFGPRSQQEMETAAKNIDEMIDNIIMGIMY